MAKNVVSNLVFWWHIFGLITSEKSGGCWKRPNYHHFVESKSPQFLVRFLITLYVNHSTLQALSNGGICMSALKNIQKWQQEENGYNSPWKFKKKANLALFCIEHNSLVSYLKIMLLSKHNQMVESACLSSKPFRNDSQQKIIHHKNSRKRPNYNHFV